MGKAWKLCLILGLLLSPFIAFASFVASCACGEQTDGFMCEGDDDGDDDSDDEVTDDAGVDAAGGIVETVLDIDTPTPYGTKSSDVLQKVSGTTSTVLQWQLAEEQTSETNMIITISYADEPITFVDNRNPGCGIECDTLRIPVRVHIQTDDGLFDDTWQSVLEVNGTGTMGIRSTPPLYLNEAKGAYTAEMMIRNVCPPDVSIDDYKTFYLHLNISYLKDGIRGYIMGTALRKIAPDAGTTFCKGGLVARWQLE